MTPTAAIATISILILVGLCIALFRMQNKNDELDMENQRLKKQLSRKTRPFE